jgi:uncharacterized protein YxjI
VIDSELEDQQDENRLNNNSGQNINRSFVMRQKMVSIGNDYWVEDDQGEQVYKIDGKIGWHKNFNFEDGRGKRLAKIHKVLATVKETMEIEGPAGEKLAVVKKDLFTPLKEHFVVTLKNGTDLEIQGNILDHEYTIRDGHNQIAQVSKKLFHVRDSYSITIEPGQDDVILLAVVVCIDEMTHPGG